MLSRVFIIVAVAVMVFQQPSLGSAQECGGFVSLVALTPDQLKKEIHAEVSSLLGPYSPSSGSNGSLCVTRISEVEGLIDSTVESAVNIAIEAAMDKTTDKLLTRVEQLITQALGQARQLHRLGSTSTHPASSCREIKDLEPSSPSGHYWITNAEGSTVRVYCDMTRSCGGITGGWMRVAKLNMSDASNVCPAGLRNITSPKRLCGINSNGPACSSAVFSVRGVEYDHVCGKIIGIQYGSPDAFSIYGRPKAIDGWYVDGVSLTRGRNPRQHIWTFAAAVHEYLHRNPLPDVCRCTIPGNHAPLPVPSYVGNDYFCATARKKGAQPGFYPEDPLWDGQGCGANNTCCTFNRPPWFMKQLSSATTDDIEMRVCADEYRSNEDIAIESVELYVQ